MRIHLRDLAVDESASKAPLGPPDHEGDGEVNNVRLDVGRVDPALVAVWDGHTEVLNEKL